MSSEENFQKMSENSKRPCLPEFNFSLNDRENAIRKLLKGDNEKILTAGDVKERFSSCLSEALEPLPVLCLVKSRTQSSNEKSCIADVIKINWLEFEAHCEPIVEGGTEAESFTVHLMDIWPLSVGPDERQIAAEVLDHYRFFMENLWYPWDEDEDDEDLDDQGNWLAEHLTYRVSLSLPDFDIKHY